MAPFAGILLLVGFGQVLLFIISFFLRGTDLSWNRVRWCTAGAIVLTWVSFFFSIKGPSSHTFFIMFPLAMTYSLYCYDRFFKNRRMLAIRVSFFLLFAGIVFHCGLGLYSFHHRSLYCNRPLVVSAIVKKDYKILGLRRADELGRGY